MREVGEVVRRFPRASVQHERERLAVGVAQVPNCNGSGP